jgi:hypothetical protein
MTTGERVEDSDDGVAKPELRYVLRRQTSRYEYQFVDDLGHVLGVMRRRRGLLNGNTTTDNGSFRSVGTGHQSPDGRLQHR